MEVLEVKFDPTGQKKNQLTYFIRGKDRKLFKQTVYQYLSSNF
jgi:hypothetical protein